MNKSYETEEKKEEIPPLTPDLDELEADLQQQLNKVQQAKCYQQEQDYALATVFNSPEWWWILGIFVNHQIDEVSFLQAIARRLISAEEDLHEYRTNFTPSSPTPISSSLSTTTTTFSSSLSTHDTL